MPLSPRAQTTLGILLGLAAGTAIIAAAAPGLFGLTPDPPRPIRIKACPLV